MECTCGGTVYPTVHADDCSYYKIGNDGYGFAGDGVTGRTGDPDEETGHWDKFYSHWHKGSYSSCVKCHPKKG